jgi:glutathionyl-hydroquinone reductase
MTGFLANGVWQRGWHDTRKTAGEFDRPRASFRNVLPRRAIRAEPGRYCLYVSLACPWAHRTLIFRALKGLADALPVVVVDPVMDEDGWVFTEQFPDRLNGLTHLHQVYTSADPRYSGRVTVPVLWDSKTRSIVNNESAEIIRMLDDDAEFYPEALRPEIDAINAYVYENVNNGVYRCGFASTQDAYERAFERLFRALDELERRVAGGSYLAGRQITEADWRLFTTLVRFDPVYHGHFKCNRNRLADFTQLFGYVCELYQVPRVAETVDLEHIKRHYYLSHKHINPSGIVPKGPRIDYGLPHNRVHAPVRAES